MLRQNGKVGFELAAYDRRRSLVIDPVLTYSTYFGGSGSEACPGFHDSCRRRFRAALRMSCGRHRRLLQHLSGGFNHLCGFPGRVRDRSTPPPAAFQSALAGTANVFVGKLNAAGSAVLFSTYLGGDGADSTAGVAADSAFNVVVAGTTTST